MRNGHRHQDINAKYGCRDKQGGVTNFKQMRKTLIILIVWLAIVSSAEGQSALELNTGFNKAFPILNNNSQ